MHESSMIGNLVIKINEVVLDAGAEGVTRVRVRIGALAGISPEHFREHWTRETAGTAAEDAALEVDLVKNVWDPLAQQVVLESVDVATVTD